MKGSLIAQHSISELGLHHASRMGGIAAPSLAIVSSLNPVPNDNYGEITLIAPDELIDPRKNRKAKTFAADIYSPRYPAVSYRINDDTAEQIRKKLKRFEDKSDGSGYYLYGVISIDEMTSDKRFRRMMQSKDINAWRDMKVIAERLLRDCGASEVMFNGFTPAGKRRYLDHTMDNVIKMMKKELLQGGESFNYGLGSIRAMHVMGLRSLKAIENESWRIVTNDEFELEKESLTEEFFELSGRYKPYKSHVGMMGIHDIVSSFLGDISRYNYNRMWDEYGFEDEPNEDLKNYTFAFLNKVKNMKTEYFETKIMEGVPLSEFKAAIVPDNITKSSLSILKKAGIKDIQTYNRHEPEERKRLVANYAETNLFMPEEDSEPEQVNQLLTA